MKNLLLFICLILISQQSISGQLTKTITLTGIKIHGVLTNNHDEPFSFAIYFDPPSNFVEWTNCGFSYNGGSYLINQERLSSKEKIEPVYSLLLAAYLTEKEVEITCVDSNHLLSIKF